MSKVTKLPTAASKPIYQDLPPFGVTARFENGLIVERDARGEVVFIARPVQRWRKPRLVK